MNLQRVFEGVAISVLTALAIGAVGAIKGEWFIRALGGATYSELDHALGRLGTRRDGVSFDIDSDLAPKPDEAQCPPGTFVSSIQISKAARTKFAAQAIAEISIVCSPIRSDGT